MRSLLVLAALALPLFPRPALAAPPRGSQLAGYALVPAGTYRIGVSSAESRGEYRAEESPADRARSFAVDADSIVVPDEKHPSRERTVTLTRDFYVKKTEVTVAEWQKVMGRTPTLRACATCAVTGISFYDTLAYANRLSASEGKQACYTMTECRGVAGVGALLDDEKEFACREVTWDTACTGYRLPTDAEWEVGARGGVNATRYGELAKIAWSDADNTRGTQPVGRKLPNAYGLYDMLGNAAEWVWGFAPAKNATYEGTPVTDWIAGGTTFRASGKGFNYDYEVFSRGGSYGNTRASVSAATRGGQSPAARKVSTGFRLARSAP